MNNRLKNQKGFSLIEVAILLMVIGIVVTPMVAMYNVEIAKNRVNETRASFADVKSAVNLYIAAHGRYPRPASLSAVEGDADYGEEVPLAGPHPNCNAAMAAWFASDGYCKAAGILIGAVPFDALGLDPEAGTDYWDNKIIYAVTTSQTDSGSFTQNPADGAITVRSYESSYDGATEVWQRLPDTDVSLTFDMVLVSTGRTAIGGITGQGKVFAPCADAPAALATKESENCDFDDVFFLDSHPDSKYKNTGAYTDAQGVGFYDDITFAQDFFPATTWFENQFDPDIYVMTNADHIGIGTNNPEDAKIQVAGNIRAGTGGTPADIETPEICDGSGHCFAPELIGGDRAEMDCRQNSLPGAEPVVEIGDSRVYCGAALDAGNFDLVDGIGDETSGSRGFQFPGALFPVAPESRCIDTGKLMKGIDATGAVICIAP